MLAARPRRKSGITLWEGLRHLAGLRQLAVEGQQGAGMPANALACSGLEALTLTRSGAGAWPSARDLALQPVARLRSLTLAFVVMEQPPPPAFWAGQAASLTELRWQSVARGGPGDGGAEHNPLRAPLPPLPIPDSLGHLTALVRLRLDYAGLQEVPAWVGALTRMRRLSLAGNRLQFEAAEGAAFAGLEALNLAGNGLSKVPTGLFACRGLRVLSLVRNPLRPEEFPGTVSSPLHLKFSHDVFPHLTAVHLSAYTQGGWVGNETSCAREPARHC